MQTDLYRHYDENDRLLYIGISLHAIVRLTEHKRNSGWAGSIRRVGITPYPSRAKAMKAEREAILAEQPLWNIVGKTKAYPRPKPKPSVPSHPDGLLDNLPASYIATLWAKITPILEQVPEADLLAFVDDAQRMRDARN